MEKRLPKFKYHLHGSFFVAGGGDSLEQWYVSPQFVLYM